MESVPEWFKARTFAKAGNEVRAGVVYEDYVSGAPLATKSRSRSRNSEPS